MNDICASLWKYFRGGFQTAEGFQLMILEEKLLLCLLAYWFILCPNFTAASLNIPQCCLLPWRLSQKCTLQILTVLAESSRESWRTVAWPVMFIAHAAILTSRTGFCAAWTPEALQTHWERMMRSIFLSPCKICVVIFIKLLKAYLHSQSSQCFPDVPAGHLHCPDTLSHGAPVQLQGRTQPVPNTPSGHSDTGHTGEVDSTQHNQSRSLVLSPSTHLGHSSLHDGQEDTVADTPQTHDGTTLLGDTSIS